MTHPVNMCVAVQYMAWMVSERLREREREGEEGREQAIHCLIVAGAAEQIDKYTRAPRARVAK